MTETKTLNLFNPEELPRQYRTNIGRSIEAYSPTHLFVAEQIQLPKRISGLYGEDRSSIFR